MGRKYRIDEHSSQILFLRGVPDNSKVLDAGCGSGKIANQLTLKKGCRVWGIEADPFLAAISRKKCISVMNANLEVASDSLPYEKGFFDVILLRHVLEHLIDPFKVLRDLKKYLSEEGLLIYSVPNIVNWHSRLQILLGRFEYQEGGVFDWGHLRFFNLASAKKLAEDAGYLIKQIDCTSSIYLFEDSRFFSYLWYKLARLHMNLLADEFIIQATKQVVHEEG